MSISVPSLCSHYSQKTINQTQNSIPNSILKNHSTEFGQDSVKFGMFRKKKQQADQAYFNVATSPNTTKNELETAKNYKNNVYQAAEEPEKFAKNSEYWVE